MTREEVLRREIEKKYGNLHAFGVMVGIPYSTLANIMKRGLGGTSVDTVLTICKALGIDSEKLVTKGIIEKRVMSIREVSQWDLELLTAFHDHPEYQDVILKLLEVKLPELPLREAHEENESESE